MTDTIIKPDTYRPAAAGAAVPLHPPHALVSWPAVIAGAIVAVAVGAMLNLLGVALGAGAFNPYDLDGGDAEGFAVAAGMWAVLGGLYGTRNHRWMAKAGVADLPGEPAHARV